MNKSKKKDGEYKVGYGKPPVATQFKKGVSGNPKGKKRSAPNFAQTLRSILTEKVNVHVDGRVEKQSKFVLLARSLIARAIKGDPSATRQAYALIEKYGLMKPEDIQHVVTVELVRPPERPKEKILLGQNDTKLKGRSYRPIGEPGSSDK